MHAHKNISRETDHQPILSCSFNQNQDCFTISHDHGFRVYSTDHMEMRVDRKIEGGGIGIAQMLHRTNYLALVGGGRNPKYSQNKVVIWDDLKRRPALSLEFLSSILNVQLSRTRIVVVLQNKVHIYAFSSPPTRIAAYETTDNPHGIVAMAENVVAFPSRTPGQVQIVSLTDEHLVSIVRAHKSPIRCLALSPDGSILASASDAGTIVRLFSTANTAPITEFRRGLDKAVIYSMAFSQQSNRLAVLSDKNTLHVYDAAPGPEPFNTNRKHILSKFPLLPTYFSGKWSFVSARVSGTRGVVGWAAEDSVVVVWTSDECRWEKWVIVDRDPPPGSDGLSSPELQFELVREAWRGFDGFDE